MAYHNRQEMIEANEKIWNREDEFSDWVAETHFNDFGGSEDSYEDDLGSYIEDNYVELVNEFLTK